MTSRLEGGLGANFGYRWSEDKGSQDLLPALNVISYRHHDVNNRGNVQTAQIANGALNLKAVIQRGLRDEPRLWHQQTKLCIHKKWHRAAGITG